MSQKFIITSGKSAKFKKPIRKIGGSSRRRSAASTRKKVVHAPIVELDAQHGPEPKDSVYKGLLGCSSVAEVDGQQSRWFAKFNGKALKALTKKVSAESRTAIEALLTRPGATSIPLLTSERVCLESAHMVRDALVGAMTVSGELEFGLVTFISGDGGTSHYLTEIELYHSQKRVQGTLRAMAPNHFGITELALFSSHGHPAGGQMLQRHEHALIWGPPGTLQKAADTATTHAMRYEPNFTNAPIIDVKRVAATPVNLGRVSAYLFKPPYKCMNWNPGKDGKPGFMNGSEKGDRNIRYLRMAMIRTMLPYEDVCFGSGEGLRIRSEMIKFVRALAKREAAHGRQILHPDAIASFWVDLMPHIKAKRWNLPVIKTRE